MSFDQVLDVFAFVLRGRIEEIGRPVEGAIDRLQIPRGKVVATLVYEIYKLNRV
jgi:hypothetical protein